MNDKFEQEMDKWEAKAKILIKWVAVDMDGTICAFKSKPICDGEEFWFNAPCINIGITKNKELRKNWEKSLRKVRYE